MDVGIEACGAYVPLNRLKRQEIARAWNGSASRGERSVANWDEDAITMAVAAGMDCLHRQDPKSIDACYLATTTSPYREKQAATLIANALDMRRSAATMDFGGTLRAGTLALRAAIDAVTAGSAKRVLVIAADSRPGAPNSDFESSFGDGAAALLVSKTELGAVILADHTHNDEILDVWRSEYDPFVRAHEDRFVISEGFLPNMKEGVNGLLETAKLAKKDITRYCLYSPDARRVKEIAGELGIDVKTKVQDGGFFDQVGNTGCALPLMLLVAALESSLAGEKIVIASYGDGCDAYALETTPKVEAARGKRGIAGHIASKKYVHNYEKYMSFRKTIPTDAARRPGFTSFPPVVHRDREWINGCKASHCLKCDRIFFPPQRVCLYCKAVDNFEYVSISRRQWTMFSFNMDNLAQTPDSPEVFCLAESEDIRVFGRLTDREPSGIALKMPLEMTFRRFHDGGGYPNYFWKFMPLRNGPANAEEGAK